MLSQTHNGALAVAYAYDQAGNATTLTYTDCPYRLLDSGVFTMQSTQMRPGFDQA